jgi:hypothetical protein
LEFSPSLAHEFAVSFKTALIAKYGKLPSTSFIANNFNLRAYETQAISRESARKWLAGISFPEGGRLRVISKWLNLDTNEFLNASGVDRIEIINEAPIVRDHLFSQNILDALSSQIAVLDHSGQIVQVNSAWRNFALDNAAPADSDHLEMYNYLEVCARAKGASAEQAIAMANGIQAVLSGESKEFVLKYPCHAPHKKRWFVARVTLMDINGSQYAIVAHEAVSEENYKKLNFN